MNEISEYSQAEIIELLKAADEEIVSQALLYMTFNIQDAEWIQKTCLEFISTSENNSMRGLAITCLGHVARIHGEINEELTVPALMLYLEKESLSERAQNALDDIEIFVLRKGKA
jgi:hypothetical protein